MEVCYVDIGVNRSHLKCQVVDTVYSCLADERLKIFAEEKQSSQAEVSGPTSSLSLLEGYFCLIIITHPRDQKVYLIYPKVGLMTLLE